MDKVQARDFHAIAKPSDPRLSPDESRVAFVRTVPDGDEEYESTVYVAPTDGSSDPRRFTVAEGRDAEPRWSPSGDRLAFASTRGADDDRQQLWVLPTDGGEAEQVTDVIGGVSELEWSPDGRRIAFVQSATAEDREEGRDVEIPEEYEADEPDPRVFDRTVFRSAQQYFDGRNSHVYVLELASGELTRITAGEYDYSAPTWGDDATLFYAAKDVGEDPDDNYEFDVVAYDLDADEHDRVHRTAGFGMALAAEGDRVACLYSEPERASIQQTELHVYDRATDAVAELTSGLDRTLGYEAAPHWGPHGETVYFTTPDEGATSLWGAAGDGSDDPERVYRGGSVDGAHVGESVTVLARSEWDHPGDVFALVDGKERRLSELNADYLAGVEVREPEPLSFESEQGAVEGWVLTPPGFEDGAGGDAESRTESGDAGSYPLAVEVHGGPHAMWTTAGSMWHEFQTLAARGYVVFWSNPRGSTGYGEEYMQAIERDWGDVTLTDVMAGVEAVASRPYVDESNVFLTGGSFGGYMTSWAVGQTDYFRAAVSQRGVYDLTGFYGSTDGAYKLVEGDFDATPWEEPEFLWEQSPVGHAHAVTTPTLVIHSDRDYRTPANTAELFHRILRKQGVDTRYVYYPREGHELSRSGEPAHIVDRIERIARWFDGYSDHHDAPRALDRPEDDGLTAASTGDEDDEQ